MRPPAGVVVMGVSGAGKTTIGMLLAEKLQGRFVDADDLHPPANIEKMKRGASLGDADRLPWLDRAASEISDHDGKIPLIVACSALKRSYRERLGRRAYHVVYLKGTAAEIERRLRDRSDHFMTAALLESQFETLEEPDDGLVLDLTGAPEAMVGEIIRQLS